MKNKYIYNLISFMLLIPFWITAAGNIYSFEDNNVPGEFSVSNGSVSISSEKAKLADKSLCWNWNANSVLTVSNPVNLTESSLKDNGGITVWVYNTQSSNQSLKFAFYNSSNEEQCSINFKLDFTGWRCLWAVFKYDMGFNRNTEEIRNMKIIAPSSQSGTFYLDLLEFTTSISWERISDFQYKLNQTNHNIINFLNIRNTVVPAPKNPNAEEQNSFLTINNRLDDWYLGTGKYSSDQTYSRRLNSMNSYITSAKNKTGSLNLVRQSDGTVKGTGLFPVTYYGTNVDGTSVSCFRNISETYLIQLAYDYRRTGNQESLNTALDIYDWFYNQGWADGSGLGSLRFEMLRSAGFYHSAWLLKDAMGDERFNNVMGAIRWYTMFGTAYTTPDTPGELADYIRTLAIPKLFYALSIKDEAERNTAMYSYRSYILNALDKAPGFKGTFKPDYSGYHHNGAYYSAYYPDALYTACLVYYILHDTPYALGDETYNHLKQALLTFRFLCGEYNVPGAITGRFPAQQAIVHQILPAVAYLGLSSETPDSELVGLFKRLWKPGENPMLSYIQKVRTDICFSSSLGEVELLLDFDAVGGNAEANPVGTLFMPYSGLLIARQPAWMVTAKGFSKYIWDYESSGTENIYGRYLSYGHLEFTDLENKNSSYNPSNSDWNWNHIPGATNKYLSYTNLDYNKTSGKHRNLSDNTFLGGISLNDNCAMFTNQVHDNAIDKSFYADKSVFVFDNLVYCLGSGINSQSTTTPVYTTLFQNVLTSGYSTTYINGQEYSTDITNISNPTIKDNYGNVFIVEDGYVNVNKNNTCMLAYINHGKVVTDKKYAYAWMIKPTEQEVEYYKNNPPISVLSQNEVAHVVYNNDKKVLALSVFKTETPVDIREIYSVSTPMLVMFSENNDNTFDLAFSDPDMKRESAARGDDVTPAIAKQAGESSEVSIVLNGSYNKIGGDSHVTVESQGDKTLVKYPAAREGQTYRVKLSKEGLSIDPNEADNNEFRIKSSNNHITIESANNESFDCNIYDITGRLLLSQAENYKSVEVAREKLSSEILVIKVSDNNRKKVFKVIK